jgi:GTP1/Obg family GTP-binding protein
MDEFFSKVEKLYEEKAKEIRRQYAEQSEKDKEEIFKRLNHIEDLISSNFTNVLNELKKLSSLILEKK